MVDKWPPQAPDQGRLRGKNVPSSEGTSHGMKPLDDCRSTQRTKMQTDAFRQELIDTQPHDVTSTSPGHLACLRFRRSTTARNKGVPCHQFIVNLFLSLICTKSFRACGERLGRLPSRQRLTLDVVKGESWRTRSTIGLAMNVKLNYVCPPRNFLQNHRRTPTRWSLQHNAAHPSGAQTSPRILAFRHARQLRSPSWATSRTSQRVLRLRSPALQTMGAG